MFCLPDSRIVISLRSWHFERVWGVLSWYNMQCEWFSYLQNRHFLRLLLWQLVHSDGSLLQNTIGDWLHRICLLYRLPCWNFFLVCAWQVWTQEDCYLFLVVGTDRWNSNSMVLILLAENGGFFLLGNVHVVEFSDLSMALWERLIVPKVNSNHYN